MSKNLPDPKELTTALPELLQRLELVLLNVSNFLSSAAVAVKDGQADTLKLNLAMLEFFKYMRAIYPGALEELTKDLALLDILTSKTLMLTREQADELIAQGVLQPIDAAEKRESSSPQPPKFDFRNVFGPGLGDN